MADAEVQSENYEVEIVIKRKRTSVKRGYGDEIKDRWTGIDDVLDLKFNADDAATVRAMVEGHLDAGGFIYNG